MKALSLWQPWASLVVLGLKHYETRSWKTAYRGTLVIHAAQKWNPELEGFWKLLQGLSRLNFDTPPRGAALGTVELVDVVKVTTKFAKSLTGPEATYGDFTPGRYAWKLANPILFTEPIPCAGHQRLWEVE